MTMRGDSVRFLVSLTLAAAMAASSVSLFTFGGAGGGDSDACYYRIDVGGALSVGGLRASGIEIIEDYGSFATAKLSEVRISVLGLSRASEPLADATTVKFNGYEFDAASGDDCIPSELRLEKQPDDGDYYLVKFLGPVKSSWTDDLDRQVMNDYGPAGPSTFLVKMTGAQKAAVSALPRVIWVGDYHPAYKIAPDLSGITGEVTLDVITYPEHVGSAKAALAKLFGSTGLGQFYDDCEIPETISDGATGYARVVADASLIPDIARIPGVQYIEGFEQPRPENANQHCQDQTGTSTSIGAPASLVAGSYGAAVPVWNNGIFGQGMVLGASDTGVRLDHYQFWNGATSNTDWDTDNGYANLNYNFSVTTHRKIIRYAIHDGTGWDKLANTDDDHGTHTTCTALGYDNPCGGTSVNDGVAPGAKLSFFDIGKVDDDTAIYPTADYSDMWNLAWADGARVNMQAWGSDYQTSYVSAMQQIDRYAYDQQTFLIIAGSGGGGTAANTVHCQGSSKNALQVGSYVDGTNSMTQATFNGNGPTYDGRLKPDVMAPGTATTSADSQGVTRYFDMPGSSMSCGNAAGSALLLNQYFLDGYYPTGSPNASNAFDPSAALIKALLINGCEQMTGSVRAYNNGNGAGLMNYPNCAQGWGRIDLDNSLYFPGDAIKLQVVDADNGVETGDYIEYKYRLTDATQNFKTTLCWSDYPAVIGAGTALVNDLDLLVISPTGAQYRGNIFTGTIGSCYTPGNSGYSFDHRNNAEEVWVRAVDTVAGEWTVRVTGYNVPKAIQPFGLVMTGALDLGYGTIQFDKDVYGLSQTATVRIEDGDAGAGPLYVEVSSIEAGKSETVTCSLIGTGVYVGAVGFTLNGQDPIGNAVLPVTATDSISARYVDVTGTAHCAYANAIVDGYGPTITSVHTGLISMSTAEILWTTGEQANGTVYYGTNPSSLTGVARSGSPYSTSQYVLLTGLAADTLYYYDVESSDIHGNKVRATNGGSHYTFTTEKRGDILLFINGGTGYDYNLMIDMYKWAMANKGWTYNVMTSWNDGNPSLATLQMYKVWIFQPGLEQYPQFSAPQRTLVKQYLDAGGRFFTTSQDTMWAVGSTGTGYSTTESISWTRSQLHSAWVADPATFTQIRCGIAGDPISGGYVGGIPYNAFRSGGYGDEITAVAAGHTVSYVWQDSGGSATPGYIGLKSISNGNNGTAGVGIYGGTPSRVVNYAFEWSCIVDNHTIAAQTRADILDLTISWLIGHDHPDVTVTAPNGGEVISGPTTTVTWTRSTYGGASVANQSLYYSPNGGSAWYLVTDAISPSATTYEWDISGLAKGAQYLVKVVVTDGGVPPQLTGADQSNGVFTIATADLEGPIIVPGSLTMKPNPIDEGEVCWINATADDSGKGNSNVAAVEYFIDAVGANGTGTMMIADGSFDSPTESAARQAALFLSQGEHAAHVHARDSAGNWGPYESTTFNYNAWVAPDAGAYFNVTVVAGWNLISFPIILENETLPMALMDNDYGVVWTRAMWYDPLTPEDPWKQFNAAWASTLNELTSVDHTMGIWLYVTSVGDGQLCLGGPNSREAGDTTNALKTGWNMIGFPSAPMTVAQFKGLTGATIVEGRADNPYFQIALEDTYTMHAGEGYWVKMPFDSQWTAHYGSPVPYMKLTKTAPSHAAQSEIITYTITYQNIGNAAYDVSVGDWYPIGVTYVSAVPAPSAGNNVWNLGDMATGASGTITISAQVWLAGGSMTNQASIYCADSSGGWMPMKSAYATTRVDSEPLPTLIKTGPAMANPGETMTYVVQVENVGDASLYNAWLNDTYPSGVTFVNANPAPTVGDGCWYMGVLAPGASATIFVNVTVNLDAVGMLTNLVTLLGETSLGVSLVPIEATCDTMVVNPDIALSKAGPATAEPGEMITYTITCSNVGTDNAYNVMVTDTYPPYETFVSAVPAPSIPFNTWIIPVLNPGASFTITITMQIDAGASGNLTNMVTADYENGAGVPYRRWANWTTVVSPPSGQTPIRIDSNADFDADHGVTGGSGTALDPWKIEGLVIDGAGYGYCIYVGNTTEHFAISDCTLTNASGIWLSPYFTNSSITLNNVRNGTVRNNTLTGNDAVGVYLFASSGNLIFQNNASNNGAGLYLHSSTYNTLSDNLAIDSADSGIILAVGSHNNSIIGNRLAGGYVGLYMRSYSNDAIVRNNTLENNDYGIEMVYVNNSLIANNDAISNTLYGIFLASSMNNDIVNNTASGNMYGIKLEHSDNNLIATNNASENSWLGISLTGSDGNSVEGNALSYNGNGIGLVEGCSGNTIENNLAVSGNWRGIWLDNSNGNQVVGNNASDNGRSLNGGWGFYLNNSGNNTIADNTASSNAYYNIRLSSSHGNAIYHNNFYMGSADDQAVDDGANQWDDGYPSGGNYWSDHAATDLLQGSEQDQPGGDGICDAPFDGILGGTESDAYPLAGPFGTSPADDVRAPSHSDEYPPIDGRTRNATPTMSVLVTDWGSGLDSSTVLFYIEGFSVLYEIAPVPDGYNVSYEAGFAYTNGQVVNCRIAARDFGGNMLDFTWHFTVDLVAPAVTSTNPFGGATGVSITTWINVTFSELVEESSAEATLFVTPAAPGSFNWTGNTMSLAPWSTLAGYTTYTVTVGIDVIDLAGNHMATNHTFSFTTEAAADTTAPQHSEESPSPGGMAVNATPVISVVVTDSQSGVNASTIRLYVGGYSIMYSVEAVAGGYRVSYWHQAGFASGAVVACRIVARDYAGNLLDYIWSFTVP